MLRVLSFGAGSEGATDFLRSGAGAVLGATLGAALLAASFVFFAGFVGVVEVLFLVASSKETRLFFYQPDQNGFVEMKRNPKKIE